MKWKALQMPERIIADEQVGSDRYGKFVVEPLERGFGVTLGTALRRVLLSSLQGVAVTAVRIMDDRVRHEFASIPGVLEDVTDVVLNLKQMRFKHKGDGPRRGVFRAKGKTEVKAGSLEISTDITVLNPDLHIATVNKDGELEMEIEVSSGKGYVSDEQHQAILDRFGWVPVDSVFSPVTKVNFTVENTRIGQRIDYDKLTVEIWTDGSLTPNDSLSMGAKILRDHFNLFIRFEETFEEEVEEVVDEEYNRIKELLERSVDELELSVRAGNCLRAAQIRSIGDLVQKSEAEMLQYRNFGKKSLKEIQDLISTMGLHFGMDVSRYLGTPKKEEDEEVEQDTDEFEEEEAER
ncbi:MAG: DNA-directed RNA polymerase subunit alpha [Candidatus Eisenbacteria bacterium]|nr:DNA-directed RNA polymerase subunit alpha [Candidatus Latescibacterota bacterium]MBD3301348.1 DNA-directed RNA polymerase subunit alpha [Candidatus Eisenbacteria bacterium]